jgi:arginine decarboxylase
MDHERVPVLEAIERFRREDLYALSLPGHRFGRAVDERTAGVLSHGPFAADVTMVKQAVPEAEALLADAVGAREAVFTTCGPSISIHTSMLTVGGPGRKVLVDRNVHKSVVASLIRAGAHPVWLRPRWDHENQIADPAGAADVADALERDPEISSALIMTPTVYGTGADVHGIAEICHWRGIPLLVDEADAAPFPFHPDLPTPAIQAGADITVQSLCEAAVILVGGDLVDPGDLRRRLDLITPTSPSALLFGSIDGFRRRMVLEGRPLLTDALHRVASLRGRLAGSPALAVMDATIKGHDGVAEWDPFKLCVDVSALGITGYQAQEWLQSEGKITVPVADARRIVCALTYGDDEAARQQLAEALERLAAG